MTTDFAPSRSEFTFTEPTAPTCWGQAVGCTVCSTANMIERFTGQKVANLKTLATSMGKRCRARDGCDHGICGKGTWCQLCSFLELDARQLPFAYGPLSWAKIEARLRTHYPLTLPGVYKHIPLVSLASYSATVPAKGQSDDFDGLHDMALYGEKSPGSPICIVGDPDFGSASRKVNPPHSEIPFTTLKTYWQATSAYTNSGNPFSVCYSTERPPDAPPLPTPGPIIGDTKMIDAKPGPLSKPIGTAKLISGRDLVDPTNTKVHFEGANYVGWTLTVLGDKFLKDNTGKAIDIDGHQPPVPGRDRVFEVDHPQFGNVAWALHGDVVFTPIN